MKFWRIRSPDYGSDYEDSFINGSLEHPYALPGVKCDVCDATWGGGRILSVDCPDDLRSHKNVTSGWPVSRGEHEALQRRFMTALALQGEPFKVLRPGDEFQPCYLNVPSRPRAGFLWPSLGGLVVSERIRNCLVGFCSGEIAVCPVTLRKTGKREATLPPPIPSTGEPEDMMDEVPIRNITSDIGPYFEVVILKESGYPRGGTPTGFCSGCGRPELDRSARELRMKPEMWRGDRMFFLATTLYVVVTDDLKERLSKLCPTNVVFERI